LEWGALSRRQRLTAHGKTQEIEIAPPFEGWRRIRIERTAVEKAAILEG
jgi:hypothetical protein